MKMILLLFAHLLVLGFWASPAYALQTHGGYEGLIAHQGAHLLFLLSMLGFAWRLHLSKLTSQKAWRLMFWGALLIGLWNVWAFSGHLLALTIPEQSIVSIETARVPALYIDSWNEIGYYALKMDHLLSLPAIILFYLGLRVMQRTFPWRGAYLERRGHDRRQTDRRLL